MRAVEKNWQIEKSENQEANEEKKAKNPSYSVIRQWLAKIGLYELQREKEKRDDWVWIMDLTVELGTEKCLVVLGISSERIREKLRESNGCLSHKDVEVLGIEIMKSTQGEKVKSVLKKIEEKVGIPQQIISDKGSDLYKGIKLYQQEKKEVIHSHDITHKMALLLKKESLQDEEYKLFTNKCNQTRQQVQQTELAFLMPPQQRSKSRYFNLDELVKWGINMINYLGKEQEKGNREKLELKLGWVKEYKESLMIWKEMISITRNIEEKIKKEGINRKFWQKYVTKYQEGLTSERIINFPNKIEESLQEEMELLTEEEIRIISSDVMESLFGKYKSFSEKSSLKEIRRMILTIPLSTLKITRELIEKATFAVKNVDVKNWEEKTFGQSMLSKRKIAFHG